MAERWRRCSACKKDIPLSGVYWVCSVSTCNRARTALVFCSVDCWEIHLPTERHRSAWAVEKRAPAVPDPAEGRAGGEAAGGAGRTGAAGAGSAGHSGAATRGSAVAAGAVTGGRGDPIGSAAGGRVGQPGSVAGGSTGRAGTASGGGAGRTGAATGGGSAGAVRRPAAGAGVESSPTDILVVASKLKAYIREGSGFHTSDRVLLVLSDALRRMCDEAIRNARRAGRDTVLDRDLAPPT